MGEMKEELGAKRWRRKFYEDFQEVITSRFPIILCLSSTILLPFVLASTAMFVLIYLKIVKVIDFSFFTIFTPWFAMFGWGLILLFINQYGLFWYRRIEINDDIPQLEFYHLNQLSNRRRRKKNCIQKCIGKEAHYLFTVPFLLNLNAIFVVICVAIQLALIAWKLDDDSVASWVKILTPCFVLSGFSYAFFFALMSGSEMGACEYVMGTLIATFVLAGPLFSIVTVVALKLDGRISSAYGLILLTVWVADVALLLVGAYLLFFTMYASAYRMTKLIRREEATCCFCKIAIVVSAVSFILFQIFAVVVSDNSNFPKYSLFIILFVMFGVGLISSIVLILYSCFFLRMMKKFNVKDRHTLQQMSATAPQVEKKPSDHPLQDNSYNI